MRRERHRPTYDLDKMKRLAARRKVLVSGRARRFIESRYGISDKREFIVGLLSTIKPRDFSKSVELTIAPGLWADVYREVQYGDERWYVKFAITNDGQVAVNVLSANWEGYIH